MKRAIVTVVCVVCVATVLTEILAAGFLWFRGQLTRETIEEIGLVISGGVRQAPADSGGDEDAAPPSSDDVMEKRVGRVWDLQRREKELMLIKNMVTDRSVQLTKSREEFVQQKQAFLTNLKTLSEELDAESTEQARGILAKLRPADAVASLMAISLEEDVKLLSGMADRAVASLLQEFEKSQDPKIVDRGRKIFEAISRGEPKRELVDRGLNTFKTPARSPAQTSPAPQQP